MSEISWFSFENKDLDFPIYKKNPYVPKWGWIVLFLSMALGYLLMSSSSTVIAIISILIPLIAVLYFLKWDIKAIFQKPKAKDIALAVALFIGYMVYAHSIDMVMQYFGLFSMAVSGSDAVNLMTVINSIPSLMTEELVKFIPFIFFLRIGFKYSNNRKLSVIVSMFLVMLLFACMHAYNLNTLIYAIFVQGLGSIFEFIGYIKTKNILISYITHLCTDISIYILFFAGF